MDAIKLLKERQSVRSYLQEDIKMEVLKDIINLAHLSPSACNLQLVQYLLITDKVLLSKLADILKHAAFMKDAPACIVVLAPDDAKFKMEDGSAATLALLLGAYAHNIGSCWINGQKQLSKKDCQKLLEIPENYDIISFVTLGYYDATKIPAKVNKKDVQELISYNYYGKKEAN